MNEHGEEIELTHLEGGGGRPNGHAAAAQNKPYSVVDVAPSESGYETDATAFSEGGMSDDDDDDEDGGGAAAAASGTESLLGRGGSTGGDLCQCKYCCTYASHGSYASQSLLRQCS